MVAGKHDDRGRLDRRRDRPLDQAKVPGDAFERAEAAEWLGLVVDGGVQRSGEDGVAGRDDVRKLHADSDDQAGNDITSASRVWCGLAATVSARGRVRRRHASLDQMSPGVVAVRSG